MSSVDTTTLRLEDTVRASLPSSLWLVWSGPGAAPPQRLGRDRTVLGRGVNGAGRLDFPGVSRRHAEVFRQGPLFAVSDLGSTNGTFQNGQRIESAALTEGDVLRLGDAVGVVVRVDNDVAPPRTREPIQGVFFGPGLAAVLDTVERVACTNLPVVLEGPTGVGKEVVARVLHALSGRQGALQAVNCGALPPNLAEAELFGHRKGAFTGAEHAGLGHVRAAHGGTLFLDELCDLAPVVQTKLLRVLQENQVTPLGETRSVSVDLRIVAASLMPLSELVAEGRLRDDLAARLAGVSIRIPALVERRADIPILLDHFLRLHSGGRPPTVDGKLLEQLVLYTWPGNVRELELLARRLLILRGSEPVLRRSMVGELFDSPSSSATPKRPAKRASREEQEPDLSRLRENYARHGNLTRAASEAGISRQRAYRLLAGRSPRELLEQLSDAAAYDDAAACDITTPDASSSSRASG